jgi:hypothetical protein
MNGIAQLNMLPEHLHQALDGYPVEELFHMGLDPRPPAGRCALDRHAGP